MLPNKTSVITVISVSGLRWNKAKQGPNSDGVEKTDVEKIEGDYHNRTIEVVRDGRRFGDRTNENAGDRWWAVLVALGQQGSSYLFMALMATAHSSPMAHSTETMNSSPASNFAMISLPRSPSGHRRSSLTSPFSDIRDMNSSWMLRSW